MSIESKPMSKESEQISIESVLQLGFDASPEKFFGVIEKASTNTPL